MATYALHGCLYTGNIEEIVSGCNQQGYTVIRDGMPTRDLLLVVDNTQMLKSAEE